MFVTEAGWRTVRTHATVHSAGPWRMATIPVPGRLLIAPQDLRTGDATRAGEIYSGRFAFAGKVAQAGGRSPFEIEPPSREWAEELMSFGWLRHLRAAETPVARANARALVGDWIAMRGHRQPVARAPEVAARRIISWLTQAQLLLQDADQAFFRRVVQCLTAQVRHLKSTEARIRDGYPRLLAVMALNFAGLCMADQARLQRYAQRRLVEELERQILPDGGHISRNPGVLVELLLDLLPLRQAFHARNVPPPGALINAIDRMMPMLRFFRHGDGAFALFNGMGPTPADSLATVLAYDDARGAPVANAPHSGYQRVEAGGTVILADTGAPPAMAASHEAHAGCLSFELSSGRHRLVVNCGMPANGRDAWRPMARRTAAHSTLTVEDASSCRFIADGLMMRLCGTPVVEGPTEVRVERFEREGAQVVRASHDGYAKRFGIVHQRSWRLAPGGMRIDGEDLLRPARGESFEGDAPDSFAVRFHLHHAVAPSRLPDGHTVQLLLPNGERWIFAAPNLRIDIEESLVLAATGGARRSDQLVITGRVRNLPRLVWTFMRAEDLPPPRDKSPARR
nr:heparinase II/III family protein [Ancylobacter crimeensis]